MIRGVLFDLDGTLLDRDATLALFLGQQFERFESQLTQVGRKRFVDAMVELDAHGHVPKPEVYRVLRERFVFSEDLERELLEDFHAWFHLLALPFPGMHETLAILHREGFRLGLITNGTAQSQRPKIEALAIGRYFQTIIVSEERGVRKPDPAIYALGLRELGVEAAEAVYVGDHPDADMRGAAASGLRTIWKRNTCWGEALGPTAAIDNLDEIPGILRNWNGRDTN